MKNLMMMSNDDLKEVLVDTFAQVKTVNRIEFFVKALDEAKRKAKGVPSEITDEIVGISEKYRDDFYRAMNIRIEALAVLAYAEEALAGIDIEIAGHEAELVYFQEKVEVLRQIILATEMTAEELDSEKAKIERQELCADFIETGKLKGYHEEVDVTLDEDFELDLK